jgi:hypothetical protein
MIFFAKQLKEGLEKLSKNLREMTLQEKQAPPMILRVHGLQGSIIRF